METFNRGRLRRLCEQGKLVAVGTYHFDDMYGASRTNKDMPVQMMPENRSECRDGTVYLFPHDFQSKSGCAYWANSERTLVTLIVHSNSNFTFRILK